MGYNLKSAVLLIALVPALVHGAPFDPNPVFPQQIRSAASTAAAKVECSLSGLAEGDKATVSISSNEYLDEKELTSNGNFSFENVPSGTHSVGITANGYTCSNALTVTVDQSGHITPEYVLKFSVTKDDASDDFHFIWEENGTVAGYTTTSSVNEPVAIEFLGKEIVPADVPSQHNLLSYFQIILSNEECDWTEEFAYRLWQTMQTFEIASNDNEPGYKQDRPHNKFILTDELLPDDMVITDAGDGNKIVRVSKDAFTYANPYFVSLEGVKGRFFSKRLHHAMTKYVTDYGRDTNKVNEILQRRFGCEIMNFDYETVTEGITTEPADHFQMFKPSELTSPVRCTLIVSTVDGRTAEYEIFAGTNTFQLPASGFYIIDGKKYMVK